MGAFFGDSRCPKDALFCEDFESGMLDPMRWSTQKTNSVIAVDGTRFARGKNAAHLKITSTRAESQAYIKTTASFPLAGNHVFVRAFYYFDTALPNRWFTVFKANETTPPAGGLYRLDLIPTSETRPMVPAYYRWMGRESSRDLAPQGIWACWEWEFNFEGANNEIHFFSQEAPLTRLDVVGTPAIKTASLTFGANLPFHPDINVRPDGFNIWIDEVAVTKERLGCTK